MNKIILRLSLLLALFATSLHATIRNDDSCDVSVMPAATLLLPYFEVDPTPNAAARTTLFTVINTTSTPQIAKVTIWTDWSYPVLEFQIYLTGYDVQAINLRDVLGRGVILASSNKSTPGSRSLATNSKFLADAGTTCGNLPTQIPPSIIQDIANALTAGRNTLCNTTQIGGVHALMTGYATIDVVASCRYGFITDASTFDTLLYDNVLTGDWQIINPDPATGNLASGSPLVHIRAIPEGGNAGERVDTNLPYTFYDRFGGAPRRLMDRRQPLPSAFAARYMQGGGATFNTNFIMWREGRTGPTATCPDYAAQNGQLPITGLVRFDERENPTTVGSCLICSPTNIVPLFTPSTSSVSSTNTLFPPLTSGDTSGWMVFNLDNGGATTYGAANGRDFKTGSSTVTGPRPSQNWVVPVLIAEGRYSAAREATALANGCSPSPPPDQLFPSNIPLIGPGPNPTP